MTETTAETGWLEIGKIVGAQGLQGEVRVYPDSDFPERFEQPGQRWLLHPGQTEPQPIELISGRYLGGKGLYVLKLAGVIDRDQAERLRNCLLVVPIGDRLPLEEGEFHVMDLLGLVVFDQATQRRVGTVTDVLSAGNDLLEVELDVPVPATQVPDTQAPDVDELDVNEPDTQAPAAKPRRVLIPFVTAIVPVVDLAQQRIEITPPAGLIDP